MNIDLFSSVHELTHPHTKYKQTLQKGFQLQTIKCSSYSNTIITLLYLLIPLEEPKL